ncbi:MAG: hypothetical protein M1819_005973 [Sarea resinae]|nr:MAG: hypothetical protein M1819_005973 [Sarea resinae]
MQFYSNRASRDYQSHGLGSSINGTMLGPHYPQYGLQSNARGQNFPQSSSPGTHHPVLDPDVAAAERAFAGFHMHGQPNGNYGKPEAANLAPTVPDPTGLRVAQSLGTAFVLPDGRLMFTGVYPQQSAMASQGGVFRTATAQNPSAPSFLAQANSYQGYMPGQPVLAVSSQAQGWIAPQALASDIPSLVPPRRGSRSSNENDAPGTPSFGTSYRGDYHATVAVEDRSPVSAYAYSTPSPPHLSQSCARPLVCKVPNEQYTYLDISAVTQMDPPIPRAVPAPSSPGIRTLERSLQNPLGTTNVYIRGLLPVSTDTMLERWASRFGRIDSVKAIVDLDTNRCKGFGFVRFFNFSDAENCIRGFFQLGYEVSFAKESFNARLKTLGDPDSTNLYVSNLPRSWNESELGTFFGDYKVVSSRILRDTNGISRGVGFARFESRDICDVIISIMNGQPIGEDGDHIQIRYADTPDQKQLKDKTSTNRQLRTYEYNAVVYGGATQFQYAPSPTNLPVNARIPLAGAEWVAYQPGSPSAPGLEPPTAHSQPNGHSNGGKATFQPEQAKSIRGPSGAQEPSNHLRVEHSSYFAEGETTVHDTAAPESFDSADGNDVECQSVRATAAADDACSSTSSISHT